MTTGCANGWRRPRAQCADEHLGRCRDPARGDLPAPARPAPRSHPGEAATARSPAADAHRPLIDVDLHMHTNHSHDCATPVEVLLESAKVQGLGAIAITDHNEIAGAQAAAEIAMTSA